jgi:replicative DNA helicase
MHEINRIPPQCIEAEKAIIGACMVDAKAYPMAAKYLKAEMFYNEQHRILFDAMQKLVEKRKNIDIITISEALMANGKIEQVGGAYNIALLTNAVASGTNLEYHARIVFEKYLRRSLINLNRECEALCYDESNDLAEIIAKLSKEPVALLSYSVKEERHISQAIDEAVDYAIKKHNNSEELKGINTGFTYFDNFSGGIAKGDLMVIGGEPSNGKTTLALNIAQNAAKSGVKTGVFSYEMTIVQLAARALGFEKNLSSKDIMRGAINPTELLTISKGCGILKSSHLYIFKPKGTSFNLLRNEVYRVKAEYGMELLVIDYLQLIRNNRHGANNADAVGEIANELKAIAVDLDMAIILLSQLSRDRANPRPSISRLKYSGDIEAAADTILMPFLPFKYDLHTTEVNGAVEDMGENALIIVGKGRNIGTTEFILGFEKEVPAFSNFKTSNLPSLDNYEVPNNFYERKNIDVF